MKRQLYPVEYRDPLKTTVTLLGDLWHIAEFQAMYIPRGWELSSHVVGGLLHQPSQLEGVDPFAPVLLANHAPEALEAVRDDPQRRIGVFLRPCEWRSFDVLANGDGDRFDNLFAISADCTGVLSVEEFEWLIEAAPQKTTHQALHFAAQGGILPSRHQASCQLCDNPCPGEVDLHFELFGVPTEEQLILHFRDDLTAQALSRQIPAFEVPTFLSERREQVLKNLARWRAKSFKKLKAGLNPEILSLQGLTTHLQTCESCQSSLSAHCPHIDLEPLIDRSDPGLRQFEEWLLSCSGCGVCDKICPQDYPLFEVIFSLRGIH